MPGLPEPDVARAEYERMRTERDGLKEALGAVYRERAHLIFNEAQREGTGPA